MDVLDLMNLNDQTAGLGGEAMRLVNRDCQLVWGVLVSIIIHGTGRRYSKLRRSTLTGFIAEIRVRYIPFLFFLLNIQFSSLYTLIFSYKQLPNLSPDSLVKTIGVYMLQTLSACHCRFICP